MALIFSETDGDGEDSVALTLAQVMLALAVVAATALALHWLGSGSEQDKDVVKQSPESSQTRHPQDREMVQTPALKAKVSREDQETKAPKVMPDLSVPSPREQSGRGPEDSDSPRGKDEGLTPPATPQARAPKITSRVAPPKQPRGGSQPSCGPQSKAGTSPGPGPLLIHFTPRYPETWSEGEFGGREQPSLLIAAPAGEKPGSGRGAVGQQHHEVPSPRTRSRVRGPGPDPFTLGTVVSVWDAIDAGSSLVPGDPLLGRVLPLGTRISAPAETPIGRAPEEKWALPVGSFQDTASRRGGGEGQVSQGQSKLLALEPLPAPTAVQEGTDSQSALREPRPRGTGLPASCSPAQGQAVALNTKESWPWKERELLITSSFSRPPNTLIRQLVGSDQGATLPIKKTTEVVPAPRRGFTDPSPEGTSPGQDLQVPSTSPVSGLGAPAKPGRRAKKGPENNLMCVEGGAGHAQAQVNSSVIHEGPGLSSSSSSGPSPRAQRTMGSPSLVTSPGAPLPLGSPSSASLPIGSPSSAPSPKAHSLMGSPSSESPTGSQYLGPSKAAGPTEFPPSASSPIAFAPTGSPFSTPEPKGSPSSAPAPTGSPTSSPASTVSLSLAPVPIGSPSVPTPKGSLSSASAPKGSLSSAPAPKGSISSAPTPKVSPSSAPEPQRSPSAAPVYQGSPSSASVPSVSSSSTPMPSGSPTSAPAPSASSSSAPAPSVSSSSAPAPSASSSSAPAPSVSSSSAPAPSASSSSAPAPSASSSSAPAPSASSSSAPAPSVSSSSAPAPSVSSSSVPAPSASSSSAPAPSVSSSSVPAPSVSSSSAPAPSGSPTSAPVPSGSPTSAPEPSASPSSAPAPSVSSSSAPAPSGSPNSAPAPSASPSSAPAPSVSSSSAPAPSASPSSAPAPSASPSSAPAPSGSPISAPTSSGTPTSAPTSTVSPSSDHAPTGASPLASLPTTSPSSGFVPPESLSSAVPPRAIVPIESPSLSPSSISSSPGPPSSFHVPSTLTSSVSALSDSPLEPLTSAPIATASLPKDLPSVALVSPVKSAQSPSEAEGLTVSPGLDPVPGGQSVRALPQGPSSNWGNLISMVLRSHPFPSPEKPQGETPQSSPAACLGPVRCPGGQTRELTQGANTVVTEPQAKVTDQSPSERLETPGMTTPSHSRSLNGVQVEEKRMDTIDPQSVAQGPSPSPEPLGNLRPVLEMKQPEPVVPREAVPDGQPAPRPRKRSICQMVDSLAQEVSPAAPSQREAPAGLVAPLTERQLQDSQLMAFLKRPGTWGTVEGQRKPSHPPKDLPSTVAAMRRHLDLGSCVEALAFAQQHHEQALAEEVYALMSDNFLLVLGDSPLYRQLSGGDRERILALRTTRGQATLGVLLLPSAYGVSRAGLAGGSQVAEMPMAPPVAGSRTYLHVFEPGRNAWLPLTLVPEEAPLRGCGLCTMHNYLFLAGGIRGSGPGAVCTNEVFCYNPLTDIWTQVRPMLQARAQLKLVALEGLLYAIGGECLYSMECYDPRTDHWTSRAPLPAGTFPVAHEAVACRGDIYVTGGHLFYRLLKYSPMQDCWAECPYSASHRRSSDMVSLGGFLYRFDLLRGVGAAVMRYNTVTGSWSQAAPLPLPEPIPLRCAVLGNTIYCLNQQVTATFTVAEGTAQFEARELKPFPMGGKGVLCPFTLTLPTLTPLQTPL